MTDTRLEQTSERHKDLKSQYQNLKKQMEINQQTYNIAQQVTDSTILEEETSAHEKEKSKLDIKKSKLDIQMLTPVVPCDDSAYSNEIERALDISDQKLAIKEMQDVFENKVYHCIKECVDANKLQKNPTEEAIQIGNPNIFFFYQELPREVLTVYTYICSCC